MLLADRARFGQHNRRLRRSSDPPSLPNCEPRHASAGFISYGTGTGSLWMQIMGHEANKYFAYARECVRQAAQAQTEERRGKLIELARVWMAAAANEEAVRRNGPATSRLPRIAS